MSFAVSLSAISVTDEDANMGMISLIGHGICILMNIAMGAYVGLKWFAFHESGGLHGKDERNRLIDEAVHREYAIEEAMGKGESKVDHLAD